MSNYSAAEDFGGVDWDSLPNTSSFIVPGQDFFSLAEFSR